MSEDQAAALDPEDLQILAMFERRPGSTLTGRRTNERRRLADSDRRVLSADHLKTEQLNLTVSPVFKGRLKDLAAGDGVSMVRYVEMAIDHYAEYRRRKGART